MKYFSKRTNWHFAENPFTEKMNGLKKQGAKLIDLTVSNPTKCGFSYLNEERLKAFQNAGNLLYDPDPKGLETARKAVCEYYARKNITLSPDQLILTAGTSEAYTFLFRLLTNSRDTIIAPQPSYPLLDYLADLNDVIVHRYPLSFDSRWHTTAQNLNKENPHPRAVVVVNPNNPTGNYVTEPEAVILEKFCAENKCSIISDEVFFDFPIEAGAIQSVSFAGRNNVLTFTLGGISKTLGLPQMKLSWIIVSGPEELKAQALERLEIISDTYLSVSTPTQNALAPWLAAQSEIQGEICERVQANYQHLKSSLASRSPKLKTFHPEGGWCAVLELPDSLSDEEWAVELLGRSHVVVHPGYLFDFPAEHFIVVSLLVEPDEFQKGIDALIKKVHSIMGTIKRTF